MEVKLIHGDCWDGWANLEIVVDGRSVIGVYPLCECPEDAILERDLGFAYDIPDLMRKAYEAGRNGESFEVIEVDAEEEDE
ncbi:hypothetical protein FDG96_gp69 [Bacillus phage Mgbh1]|uniref:Uncharacterized protein n=1 Tax=Bacillus phage Mgbh1 TaxID=1796993 RepID=A0A142F1S1_9CAUD|nr:hypothetical protein FDG96_gp69 [Bacillus phage Mgbh1]AMQ66728.1 hypothetical protein [Bacillus phage Mgbh1]